MFNRRQFLFALAGLGTALVSGPGRALIPGMQQTRVIPSTGERIPAIGLGSWLVLAIDINNEQVLSQRESVIRAFLENGGGMLDSSPMYGVAQDVIGRSLARIGFQKARELGLFSATKVWTTGHRQGFLQMENSRELWGLPSFDLMQVHNLVDWETHLPVLHAMKEKGQIRYVGVTTSHLRRHERVLDIMRTQKLDFVQFTYNMLDRKAEKYLLPMAAEKGIAVIINRPFQRGGLFERFRKHLLPPFAKDIGCVSWAQFFLKFVISHPAVTCTIPATSRVDHVRENKAAGYGRLPGQAMRKKMVQYIESL